MSSCTSLTSLTLEAGSPAPLSWEVNFKHSFLQVAALLRESGSLAHLRLVHIPGTTSLLGQVLKSPNLRLADLNLKLVAGDDDEAFYSSLAHQDSLEFFSLLSQDDPLDPATVQHVQFVRSLCRLRLLKKLDLMQTLLTVDNLRDFGESLLLLEEFSFDGEDLRDDALTALVAFPRLRTGTNLGGFSITSVGQQRWRTNTSVSFRSCALVLSSCGPLFPWSKADVLQLM